MAAEMAVTLLEYAESLPDERWVGVQGLMRPRRSPTGRTWICETGEHRYHRNERAGSRCWIKSGPILTIPVIGGRWTVLEGG